MRFSTEKEIIRYPIGTQTSREPEVVSEVTFLQYALGGDLYVWRTPDLMAEVGRRGSGGTYYVRVNLHILEASYTTLRGAMRAAAKTVGAISKGIFVDVQKQYASLL